MTKTMEELAGVEPKRYCINCKHIGRNGSGDATKFRCFAPGNTLVSGTDLVTGEPFKTYHRSSCYDARLSYTQHGCGPEGAWFEEAPSKPAMLDTPSDRKNPTVKSLLDQLGSM